MGTKAPHRVICDQGHETAPRPNDIQQTGSICRICAGHDAETSWQAFQDLVVKQGGSVVEPGWLGNKNPHRVVCEKGHACTVRPNNVQQGGSICRTCAYKVWDVFYVVVNDEAGAVKFGVTSHDARARLRHHQADGFSRVIRTISDFPDAFPLERAILAILRSSQTSPIRGREYYDIEVLPAIIDAVDGWLVA
ncbi:hypothetical protein [Streptomyces sp. ME18-1-4]|uniref:hypothetical protein n=1 Tax=Streptomyces sp. ME18-1-4 TaxID=3028685 RepID=UPI0029B980B9|nr:hypothetical protein [Streptomyces sp. ME18-1-4]MDX3245836.1 hypothetical protein [Streptomyces sp. ME18-1-4]